MTGPLERARSAPAARLELVWPAGKWLALIIALLALDQGIKIAVWRTMVPHEDVSLLGRWLMLRLELNDGTALGFPFASELDRYLRILLKAGLTLTAFFLLPIFERERNSGLLVTGLALAVAGLAGNLIDRVAHGVLLGNSLPVYSSPWLHGRIIDMFSCPWLLTPVFNFADAVLTVGGILAFIGLVRLYSRKPVTGT